MKKNILLLLILCSCNRVQPTNTLRSFSGEVDPAPSSVDLTVYAPPPLPDLTSPVSIRTVTTDSATSAAQAVIRQGMRFEAPFNGICLNTEAEAVIEATINEQIRNGLNERRRVVAEVNAHALRDLQNSQNDLNLLRSVYQARIRDRDNEINNGNRIIQTLERNNVSNIWYNMGWVAAGAAIGIVASSVYLIVTH